MEPRWRVSVVLEGWRSYWLIPYSHESQLNGPLRPFRGHSGTEKLTKRYGHFEVQYVVGVQDDPVKSISK